MKKVKVLITDDSIFMRKLLSDLLDKHPQIEVVATAKNGIEALEKIQEYSPDVVTLDVEMPKMNGLQALDKIMQDHPVPIIMLSSTTAEGSLNTIIAMEKGAVDFVAKPSGAISLDIHKVKEELIAKILLASKTNVGVLHPERKKEQKAMSKLEKHSKIDLLRRMTNTYPSLVCIGTSTGGPRALQAILTKLPKSFPAPVFIVQHMPKHFTKSLASRLDSMSAITVVEALHNQTVEAGTAYIAPGDFHMEVIEHRGKLVIQLLDSAPLKGHRPSVDVLFASIGKLANHQKVAVILTGMGNDGTAGLMQMKEKSAGCTLALAESEGTSVVFGMPKAAIRTGFVDEVLDLNDVAQRIQQYIYS
ncbi:protein-glutamate methylesterase/protein-glutamine glutaminase [Sutcliffiella horikoshii]|uniref:protein-glutamate methylesterase/protein-glutamine glutaminase n=1 Tax=Sutcliffiella horikoshii TaxID=79883 RepID=UPI001F36310C|nr:chemotaxis response regulator protein-glutamate methylesterase [Sutcliffiella horikoshii]MCG1020668.1 chemotaxis response regulator protein-glutamate methylesterase [Sutcliffiella horikoshii]